MQDNTVLVETKDLQQYFKVGSGYLHAVDKVNIKVYKGKTLGVVGESGCGKSTLGRTILQLLKPTGGDVLYNGKSIINLNSHQMRDMRKRMQIIFQDPYSSIDPRMSVFEIIAENMLVNKTYATKQEVWNRTAELMDIVGLARRLATAYPHELDGGRRQRIGVARALSLNPEFIVCDEPVSALDVSIQAQVLNLLMDLQDQMGLSYLFITHDLSVVKHISDEIAVMYLGQCVETAPSAELFNNPKHPYTKALLSAIPEADISMRNKKVEVIKGELSSPIDPKPGCRFASRCPYASAECEKEQVLKDLGDNHYCACHLAQQ